MGWMMLYVLAPEIGVVMAMDQYLLARGQCRRKTSRESQENRKVDESKVVEDGTRDVETATAKVTTEVTTEVKVDKGEKQEITTTHIFFANMGGFNSRICALSLLQQDQDHNQRNPTLPDNFSQAEIAVAAVDKTVAAVTEVSFPLRNWNELGKYSPKLYFELDSLE